MRRKITFRLGGRIRELHSFPPTTTVLQYLRGQSGRTGTKEGCAEGDCGACSVVVVRPGPGGPQIEAINSCIRFLPTLDGCCLVTVEDLAADDGTLHPVQHALVAEHGSQCGFCTPGFVMTMAARAAAGPSPACLSAADELAGNLCRCTGYGPILRAAESCFATPSPPLAGSHDPSFAETSSFVIDHENQVFWSPTSKPELAALLAAHPDATVLAGATDVGLWVTKQHRRLDKIIWTGRVAELTQISWREDCLVIGAAVSYRDAYASIASLYPDAGELMRRLGSVQIRNAGTIGGNVANGSPIGDMSPFLIAAGAELEIESDKGSRRIPVEAFFLDYGRQDLRPAEFISTILLPRPSDDTWLACYKISKRFDQDISAVCLAIRAGERNTKLSDLRIAFGGMAGIPKRASSLERALEDSEAGGIATDRIAQAIADDFSPLSDRRASRAYRLKVACNLVRKALMERQEGMIRMCGRGRFDARI